MPSGKIEHFLITGKPSRIQCKVPWRTWITATNLMKRLEFQRHVLSSSRSSIPEVFPDNEPLTGQTVKSMRRGCTLESSFHFAFCLRLQGASSISSATISLLIH